MQDNSNTHGKTRYWVIVPAAGSGKRMGGDVPKQYLALNGRSVLEHTLYRLSLHSMIAEIVVVLAESDPYWDKLYLDWVARPVRTVVGGSERCHSVLNGLLSIKDRVDENDWVLVHDAARPCVRPDDIESLISECQNEAGGLLGVPVKDTMKQVDSDKHITNTLEREHIWHALTPQIFRYKHLYSALANALEQNLLVTDEAMAMELAGFRPKMVCGSADNIKITHPDDLALAEFYLDQQRRHGIAVYDDGMDDGG
jgi:2-C-methyl-D-erythritol 4-phosphate cytidylyltransferase